MHSNDMPKAMGNSSFLSEQEQDQDQDQEMRSVV